MRLCMVLSLLPGLLAPGAHAAAGDYAIVGATVHTLTAPEPLEDAVVLVSDGRIKATGQGLVVPEGYKTVDARGAIVTPGLIESYSQLGLEEVGGEASTFDSRVAEYPSGAAFDVRYGLNGAATALAVNRRDGVTRAIVAPAPGNDPFAGWAVAINLAGGQILTQVDVALFGVLGAAAAPYVGGSRSAVVQRMRRGLSEARRYNAARYQPGPGDYSRQDMAALKRFLVADVPLVLEVHRDTDIREAVAIAEEFALDLVVLGGSEAWKVRDLLAQHDVPVIVRVLANLPVSFDQLGARLDNAALLHAAGVEVLLSGGETLNVRWMRQAGGNAVAHGLPWAAALRAMTAAPAEVWQLGAGYGTLADGAPADLVIWSGDPLELASWPLRVMIDGEWQDNDSRQTRLFERYRDLADPDFYYR